MQTNDFDQEILKAVIEYRKRRAALKIKYRKRLEAELEDELVEVGRTVQQARSVGRTVDQITSLTGNRNRAFIYSALGAYKASEGYVPEEDKPEREVVEDDTPKYVITYSPDNNDYTVKIGTDTFVLADEYDVPDAWLDDRQNKALYTTILDEIERMGDDSGAEPA